MPARGQIAEIFVSLGLDLDDLNKGIADAGKRLRDAGRSLSLYITAPLAAIAGASVHTAAQFDASMRRVSAVSGATGEEFTALSEQAKELGRTTAYTASQAADAMGFLGMAGFDATQILAAMPSTLQLAAAAQLDLGQAADITSNILTGYRMNTEQLGHANDVLVAAFTGANTDLSQLGEAMKYVGPIAVGMGVSFEETAAAVALLGNAGIQGSMAGTSLRGALSHLANPTAEAADVMQRLGVSLFDSSGQMVGFTGIVAQLEQSGATAADMLTLFGDRAGPGMAALVGQGSAAMRDFVTRLESSGGSAARIAGSQMAGLNGALLQAKSAMEGAAIAIGETLAPLVIQLAQGVQALMGWFTGLTDTQRQWVVAIAGVAAAAGPLLVALGAIAASVTALIPAIGALGTAFMFLAANPIGLVITAFGALVTAGVLIYRNWDEIAAWAQRLYEAVRTWIGDRLVAIMESVGEAVERVKGFFADMYHAVVGGSYVPDMITGIEEWFGRLDTVMVDPAEEATGKVAKSFEKMNRGILSDLEDVGFGLSQAMPLLSIVPGGGQIAALGGMAAQYIGAAKGLKKVWGGVKSIFGFADGGMVTGPTFAMVGEGPGTSISNPEVIAPLDKLSRMVGGTVTVHNHIEVGGREVASNIANVIVDQLARRTAA